MNEKHGNVFAVSNIKGWWYRSDVLQSANIESLKERESFLGVSRRKSSITAPAMKKLRMVLSAV